MIANSISFHAIVFFGRWKNAFAPPYVPCLYQEKNQIPPQMRLRPLALRRLMILRPPTVLLRHKNPHLRLRFIRDGWKVRLMNQRERSSKDCSAAVVPVIVVVVECVVGGVLQMTRGGEATGSLSKDDCIDERITSESWCGSTRARWPTRWHCWIEGQVISRFNSWL